MQYKKIYVVAVVKENLWVIKKMSIFTRIKLYIRYRLFFYRGAMKHPLALNAINLMSPTVGQENLKLAYKR